MSQPVDFVVDLLTAAGYDSLLQPVTVAGVNFEFAAILAAKSSLDLVVIIDTITDTDLQRARRRVEGMARALDVVESRRPVTVVVTGPEPPQEIHLALTRVARVLITGVVEGEAQLRDAIAILLPLKLTTASELPTSWRTARAKLLTGHPAASGLIDAAKFGSDGVARAARRHLLGDDVVDGDLS